MKCPPLTATAHIYGKEYGPQIWALRPFRGILRAVKGPYIVGIPGLEAPGFNFRPEEYLAPKPAWNLKGGHEKIAGFRVWGCKKVI